MFIGFIGEHKYWLTTNSEDIDAYNDEGDYLMDCIRLYRDQRDFVNQYGDT